MPVMNLRDQQRAFLGGVEQSAFWHDGIKVWAKFESNPVISIETGGGYAGSVYQSTVAGQWTADGVSIPGQTGDTFQMTLQNEGKAIRCGASNTIEMWTPDDLPASIRLFWFDMRRALLIDDRIERVPDSWGSSLEAVAPSASWRPNTATLNGQLVAFTADIRYPGDRRLAISPTPGLSEIIAGYQTPPTFSPAPPYGDQILMGAEGVNNWRRVRSVTGSPNFATEGNGTFVDDQANSTGVAPTARIGAWRTTALAATGVSLWGRGSTGSDGSLPGWQFQAIGLNRTTTNIERRLLNAYIAWVYGGVGAAEMLPSTNPYRTAPPRIQ